MKLKQLCESQFPTSKEDVEEVLELYKIENYTINDDLTVDVDGDVVLVFKNLTMMPVKFGKVGDHFYCANNQLTSLVGSPKEVGGSFECYGNELTSLKGAPREVGGSFFSANNQLTSLKGSPREVGGDFYCYNNQLTSLKGAPREVGGDFDCVGNQLTSLDGIGNVDGEIYSDLKNQ